MRWILSGLAVGACLWGAVGCRAKHHAVESASVEIRDEAATRVERVVGIDAVLERIDNVVVERPEIVIHDATSGATVTVRGERLARERRDNAVVEQTEHCATDSIAAGSLHTTADSSTLTEGKSGFSGTLSIVIATIAVWLILRLKKAGAS